MRRTSYDHIATEYDVRKTREGDFPMAEYVARFPQMAADLISYLIAPKRRDHTLLIEKDQSKQVTESPGLQNTIIEPSLSALASSPLIRATTFTIVSTTVSTDLIVNGSFEKFAIV